MQSLAKCQINRNTIEIRKIDDKFVIFVNGEQWLPDDPTTAWVVAVDNFAQTIRAVSQ